MYPRKNKWIGYDEASNIHGAFNGLKALILKNNPLAYQYTTFFTLTSISGYGRSKEPRWCS